MAETQDDKQTQAPQIQLPKGFEDATPVQLPKGFEDATPVGSTPANQGDVKKMTPPVTAGGKGRALQLGPDGPLFVDAPEGDEKKMEDANAAGVQTGGKVGMTALAIPAAIAAPWATVTGLAGGYGGGKLARYASEKAGGDSDMQDLSELGGNLFGGLAGGVAGDGLETLAGKALRDPVTGNADWGFFGKALPRSFREYLTPDNPSTFSNEATRTGQRIAKAQDSALAENSARDAGGTGATEPSAREFYENRAEDLMKRGKEQDALDRLASRNAPSAAPKGLLDLNAGVSTAPSELSKIANPTPFPASPSATGSTGTTTPKFGPLPPVVEPPKGLLNINDGVSTSPSSLSSLANPTPLEPSLESISSTGTAKPQFTSKLAPAPKPEPNKIVPFDSKPPATKVTYQDYNGPELQALMDKGDVEAMKEFKRNPRPGAHLPANAKFFLEEADRQPWRNLKK